MPIVDVQKAVEALRNPLQVSEQQRFPFVGTKEEVSPDSIAEPAVARHETDGFGVSRTQMTHRGTTAQGNRFPVSGVSNEIHDDAPAPSSSAGHGDDDEAENFSIVIDGEYRIASMRSIRILPVQILRPFERTYPNLLPQFFHKQIKAMVEALDGENAECRVSSGEEGKIKETESESRNGIDQCNEGRKLEEFGKLSAGIEQLDVLRCRREFMISHAPLDLEIQWRSP